MDAFYAAVEQRDDPSLRGVPLVVGGPPDSRAVVCTASYEARKFGIRSAMPCSQARRLCPHAVFVAPRFPAYVEVSQRLRALFREYTELVEPLSLDEAYLEIVDNRRGLPSVTAIAQEIRARIRAETGLTASAGVSFNKFLAKCASDRNKPDGLTVIRPEDAAAFLAPLPIGTFFGVGKATQARFEKLGIRTGGDLLGWSEPLLSRHFGPRAARHFWRLARGIDERPVQPFRPRHSLGSEDTFARDTLDLAWMREHLVRLCRQVAEEARAKGFEGRTAVLKVKYGDFRQVTRSRTLPVPVVDGDTLAQAILPLLELTEAGRVPVRLLGVTIARGHAHHEGLQLELPLGDRDM
jgi:DNA polymerase-4